MVVGTAPVNKDVSKVYLRQESAAADAPAPLVAAPVPEQQKQDVDKPWNKLNESESESVKQTLMKVRVLRYWGFRVREMVDCNTVRVDCRCSSGVLGSSPSPDIMYAVVQCLFRLCTLPAACNLLLSAGACGLCCMVCLDIAGQRAD